MRKALICLAGVALIAACSKTPAGVGKTDAAASPGAVTAAAAAPAAPAVTGAPVSGIYTGNGKPATLSYVTSRADEPFDGKPVIDLIFTQKDQAGSAKPDFDAVFGKFGDAIVVRVQPDGNVIGADVIHSGLKTQGGGSISISGVLSMKDYRAAGGQISGHLTSGGPIDVFDQKVEIDLTFHTKAPG